MKSANLMPQLPNIMPPKNTPERLPAGEVIVSFFRKIGVEYVFGIPGGPIEPFFDAMAISQKNHSHPKMIISRHETGASYMAEGYALRSGRLGVCVSTVGPGATNLLTGIASAYTSFVPMLVITAQTRQNTLARRPVQDSSRLGVDTVGMFEKCTKMSIEVTHPSQIKSTLYTAIKRAIRAPAGPVHLSFSPDVLRAEVDSSLFDEINIEELLTLPDLLDKNRADLLVSKMLNTYLDQKESVFIIGDGAEKCAPLAIQLATLLGAHIITVPQGKGFVSTNLKNFKGVLGFAGHESALQTLQDNNVENIISLGVTLYDNATEGWSPDVINSKLVVCDDRIINFEQAAESSLHIQSNLLTLLKYVDSRLKKALPEIYLPQSVIVSPQKDTFPEDKTTAEENIIDKIYPPDLLTHLQSILPSRTQWFADSGNSMAWLLHHLSTPESISPHSIPGGWCRTNTEYGGMGWAIGISVGAAISSHGNPIVCLTGDGSFLMNGTELTVAIQHQLPVIFVVLNDSSFGMVKHGQKMGSGQSIGTEIPFTDFSAIAKASGAQGFTIHSIQDLDGVNFDLTTGPIVLDCLIDPDAEPPIGARLKDLIGKQKEILT